MTLTIDLTPDLEAVLHTEAARRGLPIEEYAVEALSAGVRATASHPGGGAVPRTGAEALAYWEREGVIGLFADRPDSPEFARALRRQAARRER